MQTVPVHTALLGRLAAEKPYVIIELPYARVIAAHVILYVKVEYAHEVIAVLLGRHIQAALAFVAEGAQTGYELQISEAAVGEKLVYGFYIFGNICG